ncbi:Uncharacterised protein [uncultured Clostridium sp.]|nr:Uncharacterised protein [uncultured Clostridium sp.]
MKKGIISVSILCTGLLVFLNPMKNMSFAIKDDSINYNVPSNIINEIKDDNNYINNEDESNGNMSDGANKNNDAQEIIKENNSEQEKSDVFINEKENEVSEYEETTVVEENIALTENLAENILQSMYPNVEYIYQGNEGDFSALQEKGLSGYVFLPNVDGDMGYFVDKVNSNIYLFHPSGYLELIK